MNRTSDNTDGPPDTGLKLAAERTQLALERTHLAWIRTIITLMTSGFAIDKLLEVIHSQRVAMGKALTTKTHFTGFVMVLTGILLLVMEGIYYIGRHTELAKMRVSSAGHISRGVIVSVLVFLVGVMLIYLIIDTG